jgi:hypothetical protein
MPSGTWVIWLDQDIQIRTRMALDRRGNVTHFTVQLEVWVGKWRPVVRYDNAHEEAHIDYIDPQGVTYDKVWLNLRKPFNVAMTRAENELKQDYPAHVERFRQQMETGQWP